MKRTLFVYDEEKVRQYKKLSMRQKLEWLEGMSVFMHHAMSKKAKRLAKEIKEGTI